MANENFVNADVDPARVGHNDPTQLNPGTTRDGMQSISNLEGSGMVDEDYYTREVDKKVVEIKPYSTPIDTILRKVGAGRKANSLEHRQYMVRSKPVATTLTAAVTAQSSGTQVKLEVADPNMVGDADTLLVLGVKGYKADGTTVDTTYLKLLVVGIDTNSGQPAVQAVNGKLDSNGGTTWVPAIPVGTKVIRMGKACCETDAQTGKFAIAPTHKEQYLQNFMCQIQQSTFDKLASKEANWNFSDVEREAVFDFRRGQEFSFLFGTKKKLYHPIKKEQLCTCDGIWDLAGKQATLGTYDATEGRLVIDVEDMIDFMEGLFTGSGVGGKDKIFVVGTKIMSALDKLEMEKIRIVNQSIERWGVNFTQFKAFGGTLSVCHDELLDEVSPYIGLVIDPDEMAKVTFIPFGRNILDLKKAGISNSEAVVLQEVCAPILLNENAFCRVFAGGLTEAQIFGTASMPSSNSASDGTAPQSGTSGSMSSDNNP